MIKVDMNKLYGLYVSKSENDLSYLVAASNEIGKLETMTIASSISIVNDPNDKTLKRQTEEGVYPFFTIREIPYVC